MFKLALIALLGLFSSVAPIRRTDAASCINTRGATCKVIRWHGGRAELRMSRAPEALRIVPPRSSGQRPFDLVFQGGPVKDCKAETQCAGGGSVSCTAVGKNTQCTSNATSVGCLTVDDGGNSTGGSASTCPSN
jgi:hypothetical protein